MTVGVNVIQSALKLLQLPDRQCFTSWTDFLMQIPNLYGVELPTGITNVTIGNVAPSSSETDNLWIQTNNSGNFVGLFIYITGAWRQIYPLVNQLFFVLGDSRNPPSGYTCAAFDNSVSALQLANMKKIWTQGGSSPDWWTAFHCTFTGW
jgi:hypothetical protein